MKYRKWDPKIKAKIVLESLQNKISLAEICNQPDKVVLAGRHQITHSTLECSTFLPCFFMTVYVSI
ncbi:MAG: hypothetical protein A3H23_04645 [Planctomycetes bacterium RIFCSPLOWO2_12_FULL_40_19]|nr:MAG: hypothetical protein A3H23_04645 [Planctomycetes bacterium RIFCSPLOWO2_12_FULL_40_19]